jgi:hypothetical protein
MQHEVFATMIYIIIQNNMLEICQNREREQII